MEELREWAADRPLFTLNDAQRALGMKRASLREKLSRAARRGDLRRIERGKYTVHEDPLVYATYIEHPSYLTLWSGLRFYDLTTQLPTRVQVMVGRPRTDLEEISFQSTHVLFGFGRRRYEEFEIFVADPERLLIDCLNSADVSIPDLSALLERIDPAQATTYALRFGRKATMKRVGFLLERYRDTTAEELRVADRNYPRLDLAAPSGGTTDPDWRLEVNIGALPS